MSVPAIPHDPYAALRGRNFRLFIVMRLCMTVAIQMQAVVVGWQLYKITNDPLALGLVGLVEAVPSIGIMLFAGHLADIYPRRAIIWRTIVLFLVSSLALASTSLAFYPQWAAQWGLAATWPIYFAVFATGLARGFLGPANFALMSQLVDRAHFANAATWNSTVWQAGMVGGPALAGLVYGWLGIQTAYGLQCLLVVAGLAACLAIAPQPAPAAPPPGESIWGRLAEGLRFVFGHQVMLAALSLDLFAVLFGGATALLPIFAKDILLVGPQGLGLLRSAPAVGSVVMMLYLAYRPVKRNAGRVLLWAVGGFGLATIGFALSQNFWLSLLMLLLTGITDSVSAVLRATLMQLLTPETMKGRVSAVNGIFISSSNEIGAFESGVAARLLGPVGSVLFGGAMSLVVVGVTAWRAVQLRRWQIK
ncbi:MAG: MFS transporter [Bernardetiaceae bacterium]|nr:MFS transporter [Bernardetiaceae bacterium]